MFSREKELEVGIDFLQQQLLDCFSNLVTVSTKLHLKKEEGKERNKTIALIHEGIDNGWISISWKGEIRKQWLEKLLGPIPDEPIEEEPHD